MAAIDTTQIGAHITPYITTQQEYVCTVLRGGGGSIVEFSHAKLVRQWYTIRLVSITNMPTTLRRLQILTGTYLV